MFTQSKRPMTFEEILRFQPEPEEPMVEPRSLGRYYAWFAGIAVIAALIVYVFVRQLWIAGASAIGIIGFAYLVTKAKPEGYNKRPKKFESGQYVETHVTATRCFCVVQYEDEGDDYYLEVDPNHTLVVNEYSFSGGWGPNSDFTIKAYEGPGGRILDEKIRAVGEDLEPIAEIERTRNAELHHYHMDLLPQSLEECLAEQRRTQTV